MRDSIRFRLISIFLYLYFSIEMFSICLHVVWIAFPFLHTCWLKKSLESNLLDKIQLEIFRIFTCFLLLSFIFLRFQQDPIQIEYSRALNYINSMVYAQQIKSEKKIPNHQSSSWKDWPVKKRSGKFGSNVRIKIQFRWEWAYLQWT